MCRMYSVGDFSFHDQNFDVCHMFANNQVTTRICNLEIEIFYINLYNAFMHPNKFLGG